MKKLLLLAIVFSTALAVVVACQTQAPGAAVPDAYQGLENPLMGNADAAQAGMVIYESRCQSCHGELALGEGPNAEGMEPPPSNLAFSVEMHADDYLFWRITEGGNGDPINSSMPGFASVLSEDEIWQVITYLHQLSEGQAPTN